VTGVDAGDFKISTSDSVSVGGAAVVRGERATYTVTLAGIEAAANCVSI